MSRGNLRLARGELPGLTKGLKFGGYLGGYYGRTLVTVVTAVLKAVSLQGGHTVAMELPSTSSDTIVGIKQSGSLTLAMYV